jgi:predicted metal-dependent HD superfamily phosphohydrolase
MSERQTPCPDGASGWSREGLVVSPAVEARLRALYATPPRAYHNAAHVDEVLARFDEARPLLRDPRVAFYALLFHDAVYVAGRKDNEEESARAFRAEGLAPEVADAVCAVILATARHGRIERHEVDGDTALALDCDMAILGASPARFQEYDAQIAQEYAGFVTGLFYRQGRRRFLAGLLARERIYLSDFFHARLEAQARANLSAALAR